LKGTGAFIQGNKWPAGKPAVLIGYNKANQGKWKCFYSFFFILLFVTVNYNYKEKYLVSFNFRRDGSSKFAEGNRIW
jgi:hypothetical protein